MEKELPILEEGPNEEIDIDALRKTFKNARLENHKPRWYTQILISKVPLHSQQTCYQNEEMHAEN